MSAVSPFDFVGTENWRDAENAYLDPEVLFTQVSPSEKASAPQAAISFTLTPVEGVTFTPTKLTVNAGRFGSDSGNQLDVYVKQHTAVSLQTRKNRNTALKRRKPCIPKLLWI